MRILLAVSTFSVLLLPRVLLAEEAVVTLRATVTGNQEQPKVMNIVPWRPPQATEFEYVLSGSLAQDLFTEIDRDEFMRELSYRELLAPQPISDEK